MDVDPFCGRVTAENAMKTMLTKRTNGAVAYFIIIGLRCEDFFSGLYMVDIL